MFSQIFAKLFAKKHEQCVEQFRSCREKKFKIAFWLDEPFIAQIFAKYFYHIFHQTDI